jgi:hypothetical protein
MGLNNSLATDIKFQEDIPTSCSILGNGIMVAAAGVIIHGTKAPSSATVQIFDYNCNSSVDRMSYAWTHNHHPFPFQRVKESHRI